jgi:hypothetical protein
MKVVLFCGGYGMRMRDGVSDLPKPMHPVGPRPLIWHVMRYYAHFGHTDFVLCLGYGAHHIKDFFLNYSETASNDFVLRGGDVELLGSDIQDWTITFVHTGLDSPIGERLRRVRRHVADEEMFLANYADALTDAPLDRMVEQFRASDAVGPLPAARAGLMRTPASPTSRLCRRGGLAMGVARHSRVVAGWWQVAAVTGDRSWPARRRRSVAGSGSSATERVGRCLLELAGTARVGAGLRRPAGGLRGGESGAGGGGPRPCAGPPAGLDRQRCRCRLPRAAPRHRGHGPFR